MPQNNIDYSKTLIYKIVCKDVNINDLYVGRTTDFKTRKGQHHSKCNNPNQLIYNAKIYTTIRENGGWENWDMVEIEKYPCNDGNEAKARERYWFEQLAAKLNTTYPDRRKKEYAEINKEKTQKYNKEYYLKNYESNKLQKAEYTKKYWQSNREEILRKMTVKIKCECGSELCKIHLQRHMTSKKHLNFMGL